MDRLHELGIIARRSARRFYLVQRAATVTEEAAASVFLAGRESVAVYVFVPEPEAGS
jgi:hypothetical protein